MKQVSENIYVQTGLVGCNASIINTTEGVVMIDTPMIPADAIKWREEIAEFGAIIYLINTEPHEDHFGGDYYFKAPIIAHEGTREAIKVESVGQFKDNIIKRSPKSMALMDKFHFSLPTITLSERLTLHLGKHTLQLINMPGHTPFQVAIFVPEEGVLFTTDNVVGRIQPGLRQALPYVWIESLYKMEDLKPQILVPGHGPLMPPDYLNESADFLREMIEAVQTAINSGISIDEVSNTISFADRYDLDDICTFT